MRLVAFHLNEFFFILIYLLERHTASEFCQFFRFILVHKMFNYHHRIYSNVTNPSTKIFISGALLIFNSVQT